MDIVKSLESCDHDGYKAVIFLKYTFKSYNVIILLYGRLYNKVDVRGKRMRTARSGICAQMYNNHIKKAITII